MLVVFKVQSSAALQPLQRGNLLLPSSQHLVERVFAYRSFDAVDPFVLLLRGRGGDSVKSVVALDDAAVCLRLTGLDHLIFVVRDEQLEAVRFLGVINFSDTQIFQWNNPSGFFISRVFEVVKAVICENKPASLPGLHSST